MRVSGQDMRAEPETLRATIQAVTSGAADPDLVESFVNDAAAAIAWLERQRVRLIRDRVSSRHRSLFAPPTPRRPGLNWSGRARTSCCGGCRLGYNDGGSLLLGTRARRLLMQDGAVAGVEVERKDERLTLSARSVVLADGGFQADGEMVRRHITSQPHSLLQRNVGTGQATG